MHWWAPPSGTATLTADIRRWAPSPPGSSRPRRPMRGRRRFWAKRFAGRRATALRGRATAAAPRIRNALRLASTRPRRGTRCLELAEASRRTRHRPRATLRTPPQPVSPVRAGARLERAAFAPRFSEAPCPLAGPRPDRRCTARAISPSSLGSRGRPRFPCDVDPLARSNTGAPTRVLCAWADLNCGDGYSSFAAVRHRSRPVAYPRTRARRSAARRPGWAGG